MGLGEVSPRGIWLFEEALPPWCGPYRVTLLNSPDVTVTKVYYPEDGPLQIHLSHVQTCPPIFPHGFYWYGGDQYAPGKIPKWVQSLLDGSEDANPRYHLRRRQPTGSQPRVPHARDKLSGGGSDVTLYVYNYWCYVRTINYSAISDYSDYSSW